MPRTCYHDVTPALAGYIEYPYAFNGGYLYEHEFGRDENEGATTNPMYWFLQTWDIGLQTDRPMLVNSIIPEFQRLRNGMQFSFMSREHPQDSYTQFGPFILTPSATQYDVRAAGAQMGLLLEAASVAGSVVIGQDFRLGVWQAKAGPHGKRMGSGSQGAPIVVNNP